METFLEENLGNIYRKVAMFIHFSSLSSFVDDGCADWFESKGQKVSLLGSLANDRGMIDRVLSGNIKCCQNFIWDSGAVSVKNQKTEITLEKYASWVKEINNVLGIPLTIVGLDVIGDPVTSQRNYLELKYKYGFGNGFMPTFHYGEDMSYLETLIEEGFDYIGLGGVGAGSRLGQDALRDWVKMVMFVNGDGSTLRYPHVKWHGFAQTSKKTMNMFPYYSVDSAAWVKNSAVGKILTPWGDWRMSNDPRTGVDPYHISRAGKKTIERIEKWFNEIGFTLEQVKEGRFEKHIININYFLDIERLHKWEPTIIEHKGMFTLARELGMVPIKKDLLDLNLLVDFTIEENEQDFIIKEVEPTMPKKDVTEEKAPMFSELSALADAVNSVPMQTPVDLQKIVLPLLELPKSEKSEVVISDVLIKKVAGEMTPQLPDIKSKVVSSNMSIINCPHCQKLIAIENITKVKKLDEA